MEDGAVGISSSLIYPPGAYATTEELTELATAAAAKGGVYFTHMRNESNHVLEAIDEALAIGRGAAIPVHIYHLNGSFPEENRVLIQRHRADWKVICLHGIPFRQFADPIHLESETVIKGHVARCSPGSTFAASC